MVNQLTHRQHCEWFVWAQNPSANGAIAEELQGGDELRDVLCEDGERRNLWKVSEQNARRFWQCRLDLPLEIFHRLDPDDKIRKVTSISITQFSPITEEKEKRKSGQLSEN